MSRHLIGLLIITAAILGLTSISGCFRHEHKADENQFNEAIATIDRMIASLDRGLADLKGESASWRRAFADLERQLHEDGKDLLANEVRNISDSFAKGLEDSVKASADYIEAKLKDNLKAFRIALDRARAKVSAAQEKAKAENSKDTKKNANGIKEAFDELANIVVVPQPVVTGFIPAHVQIMWKDYTQATGYSVRVNIIEVRGWGFERPVEETAPRFGVSIVTRDDKGKVIKERSLPLSALFSTTRYLMQIKLDAPGVKFKPEDNALVFKLGPSPADLRYLPINHVVPEKRDPVQPTPPPKITGIILYVGTTWDDKDKEITFHYTIHRKSDGKQVGGISVGRDEVWPDPKERKPDWRHFTIPITEAADRFTEADRLGYRLHVRYDSYKGDPKWNGRLRADAILEGGSIIPVLTETSDFDMGHHDRKPENVNRDFDFNK